MADSPRESTSHRIVIAVFITWSISVIFVLARVYTRAILVRKFGPSDWTIVLALLFAGGYSVATLIQTQHGMGRHMSDIDIPQEFPTLLFAWWWSLLCYTLTLTFSKVSICLLYLTIFTLCWARRACYFVLGIVVLSNLWALATDLTFTIPLAASWDSQIVATYSTSKVILWIIIGFIVATDVLIFILPIPIVAPLHLPRRQKLAVIGIFAVGFFTVFVSFFRLGILIEEQSSQNPDFTYNSTNLIYWTALEVNTPIVVGCTMTLKPLVSKLFPHLLDSRKPSAETSIASGDLPLTIGSRPIRCVGSRRYDRGADLPRDVELGVFGTEKRVAGGGE